MNFFSVCFRTSRAIPGEIPGQAYGNFPSPLRKGLQSFPESTPVLPEKNWSTPRRGLETDTELLPQPSVYTLSQVLTAITAIRIFQQCLSWMIHNGHR